MKRIIIILIALMAVFGLAACGSGTANEYSYEEVKELVESGEGLAVDVRTAEEYESGHIINAYNLPLSDIQGGDFGELDDKDALLFVYCRSGSRSSAAYKLLVDEGYTNVQDLGGIQSWPYGVFK